jgi:hypothetical protein
MDRHGQTIRCSLLTLEHDKHQKATRAMWHVEHLCNFSVLQRVHFTIMLMEATAVWS